MSDAMLKDKVALVTGASRGIGAATARALAAAGAHVILTARTTGALEEVEDAIHASGGTATIAPLDLMEGDGIPRLAAAIGGRWDTLDVLVLNAGTLGSLTSVTTIDAKEMARVMTLNVTAQAAMIGAFDPMLRRSKAGRVIGVTSSVARRPRAYWGPYAASKSAFETLLLTYGDEVSGISPVRTAIVDPGATRTKMRARAYPGEDPATVKPPETVADAIVALLGEPFEDGHFVRVG